MQIKLLNPSAQITKAYSSAGYDLHASTGGVIPPGKRMIMPTGISVAITTGHYGQIHGRSGLAVKYGIAILAGVIDGDYRGEVSAVLLNTGDTPFEYKAGDRIAQMLILPCYSEPIKFVEELDNTERQSKGFGSSG